MKIAFIGLGLDERAEGICALLDEELQRSLADYDETLRDEEGNLAERRAETAPGSGGVEVSVADGVPLGEGDSILTTTSEYWSNLAGYLHLRDTRGVDVRVVPDTPEVRASASKDGLAEIWISACMPNSATASARACR